MVRIETHHRVPLYLLLAALLIFLSWVQWSGDTKPVLRVWTYPGYIPNGLIKDFETLKGCKVRVSGIGTAYDAMNKVTAGEYTDVFVTNPSLIERLYQDRLILPLSMNLLPHWQELYPEFRDLAWNNLEGEKVLGVPYTFGAIGLGVRQDLIPSDLPLEFSWSLLWHPANRGKVAVNSQLQGILVSLLDLGEEWDDFFLKHLPSRDRVYHEVVQHCIALRKNCLKLWSSGADVQNLMRNGQIIAADIWDGLARQLTAEGRPVTFHIPPEGAVGWTDLWVVSSRSKHPNLCYDFFNFLETTEAVESVVSSAEYCRCNMVAMAAIPEELRLRVSYTDDERDRLYYLKPIIPEYQSIINEMIEEIRLGK